MHTHQLVYWMFVNTLHRIVVYFVLIFLFFLISGERLTFLSVGKQLIENVQPTSDYV